MLSWRMIRTVLVLSGIAVVAMAEVPEGYRPMTPWLYQKADLTGIYGHLYKKDGLQQSNMLSFEVDSDALAPKNQKKENWMEFRYPDGTWQKVYYGFLSISEENEKGFIGAWRARFPIQQDDVSGFTAYRIVLDNKYFAEQEFQEEANPPFVRIWEPGPKKIAWDLKGRVSPNHTQVLFSRDYAENWWMVDSQKLNGDNEFQEFNLKDAKHPLLIRIVTYQDFRRFVTYYQMGRGYVTGPEAIGAPKGRK